MEGGSIQTSASGGAALGRNIRRLQPSTPCAPILKIKGLAFCSATRIACEPAVPQQKVANYTIAMFGALVWIRPWNVSLKATPK